MFDSIRQFFETLLVNLRAADVIDVALIAGLIYAVLAWMRDRVSHVVGFGIVLVAVIYALAQYLDLYLTSMVFQVGIVAIILSLIVVFQDDIRRLFEQLRVMKPWETTVSKSYRKEMDTLVEAVGQMVEKRVGALIVLRGREALDVHLHGGIEAHAAVSVPILLSIFNTKTPGHDGAVIIDEGRIEKFAVHLPLSTKLEKLGRGGTRHAAGLGLAERCDALVIVVSEERGTVSVGREHELAVLDSAAELGPVIEKFQESERHEKRAVRGLPRWVTHNLWLKLIAGLMAASLWMLFAYRVETVQRTYEVPIEYRGLAENWYVQDPKPISARVELSGSERAFDDVDPASLKLSVDLSRLGQGTQRIALSDQQFDAPTGLTVNDIIPHTLRLTAQKLVDAKLPVDAQLQGEPAAGFEIVRVVTEPGRVDVEVPEHLAEAIDELQTEPIPIDGLSEDKTVKAQLLPGKNLRFPGDSPPAINVRIEVARVAPEGTRPAEIPAP
jgi:uncharacterized protein (TIGR00159 family)